MLIQWVSSLDTFDVIKEWVGKNKENKVCVIILFFILHPPLNKVNVYPNILNTEHIELLKKKKRGVCDRFSFRVGLWRCIISHNFAASYFFIKSNKMVLPVTTANNVKVYTVSGGLGSRSIPDWLARQKKKALKKDFGKFLLGKAYYSNG